MTQPPEEGLHFTACGRCGAIVAVANATGEDELNCQAIHADWHQKLDEKLARPHRNPLERD